MKRKPIEIGNSVYMDQRNVPAKYREELDAIVDNVRAIHGENFVQHVKFVMNIKSLIGLIVANTTLNDGIEEHQMQEILSDLTSNLAASHADARGLDEEDSRAVFRTVDAMDSIVKTLTEETNAERRKRSH